MLSMTSRSLRSCNAKACFLVRSLLVVRLSILSVTCFDRKTCLRSRIESVKSRLHTSKRWVQSSTAGACGRRVGPSGVWLGALAVSYPFFSRLWQTATGSKTGSFSTEHIGLTSNKWRRGTLDYTGWFGIGSAEGWAFGQSTGWIPNHSMMHQCNISYITIYQKYSEVSAEICHKISVYPTWGEHLMLRADCWPSIRPVWTSKEWWHEADRRSCTMLLNQRGETCFLTPWSSAFLPFILFVGKGCLWMSISLLFPPICSSC